MNPTPDSCYKSPLAPRHTTFFFSFISHLPSPNSLNSLNWLYALLEPYTRLNRGFVSTTVLF